MTAECELQRGPISTAGLRAIPGSLAGRTPRRPQAAPARTQRVKLPTLCTREVLEASLVGTFADMSDSRVMNLRFPGNCGTCGAALDRARVPIGTHKTESYIARHISRADTKVDRARGRAPSALVG